MTRLLPPFLMGILACATLRAGTLWTFTLPSPATGTFSASESTTSSTVSGTYSRLANGYIKLTITAGTGANVPPNGTVKFAIEVPGYALFSQPILTTERKIISSVAGSSVCPTSTWSGIMSFAIWAGTSGTTYNVNNAATPAFGIWSWNPATNQVSVTDLRNLTAFGTITGFASFNLPGVCSAGVITFSGAGDRGGKMYVSANMGGVYLTNTDRAIFVTPQVAIPAAAALNGNYTTFNFNEVWHTDIRPIRLAFTGGTTGTGDELTDMELGTTDTSRTWAITGITINNPVSGAFRASLSLEGGTARNIVCAVYFAKRNTFFCASQAPDDATRPMNFVMVSDASYFASGTLDTYRFGTGLKALNSAGTTADYGRGLVIQPDGKIAIAGYNGADFFVGRYLLDGNLDTTFDTDGKLTTNFTGTDQANAIALDATNKILVAGFANTGADMAVARYLTTGALDTTFSADGKQTVSFSTGNDQAASIAIQPDGRIVLAGFSTTGNIDIALARLTTAGVLDTTFSGDGKQTLTIGTAIQQADGMVLQTDGKILVCGYHVAATENFITARYLSTGVLDTTFTAAGYVVTDVVTGRADRARNCTVDLSGNPVVVGYTTMAAGGDAWSIVRYTSAGVLDTTFNSTGKVNLSWTANTDRAYAVAIDDDLKYLVGGYAQNATSSYDMAIARYLTNGALDTTFSGDGMYTVDFGANNTDAVFGLAIQSDDKIVAAGWAYPTNNADMGLIRLWP